MNKYFYKYFYPIYKMKLKPWIKYWLIKKLNGSGESTLKVETISSGTLTKVDKSKALSIKQYYGNTIQDGTPTPEAPIPVQVVKEDNTITINGVNYNLKLKSKNLLNNTLLTTETTRNGITATPNADGSITLNGTSTANVYLNLCRIDFGTTSFNSDTGGSTQYVASTSNPLTTVRITYDANNKYTFILIYSGNTLDNFTIYPMIEEGSEPTAYEPYYNYELCKIGNYQDKLYYDSGKWYLYKEVEKVVLNGSENIGYQNNVFTYSPSNVLQVGGGELIVLSNYYVGITSRYRDDFTELSIGKIRGSNNQIAIKNTNYTTVADFKTWLTNNNTTVYYVLATPTTEEITDSNLISQLNALYEFYVNSSTVTISNDSEIPFEFLLEYYGR